MHSETIELKELAHFIAIWHWNDIQDTHLRS
jgi:hypothetical protein